MQNVIYSVLVFLLSILLFQVVVFAKSKEYVGYLSGVICSHKGVTRVMEPIFGRGLNSKPLLACKCLSVFFLVWFLYKIKKLVNTFSISLIRRARV